MGQSKDGVEEALNELGVGTQGKAEEAPDPMAGIQEFFEQFSPPESVTIKGAFGGVYKLSSVVPGTAEIVIMRELRNLADAGIQLDDVGAGKAMQMVSAALSLATNDQFIKSLDKCFSAAYPKLLREEYARAVEQGEEVGKTPLDLFPVSEAIKVFVPFFAGLLGTGAEVMEWFKPSATP